MSALFAWSVKPRRRLREGDRKTVTRFLWWPTTIEGECRWLGSEDIVCEAYLGWVCPPGMPAYRDIKWRNVMWADYSNLYTLTAAGKAYLKGCNK